MTDPPDDLSLLALPALLGRFDEALLRALGYGDADIARVRAAAQGFPGIEGSPEPSEVYDRALARLRAERPDEEVALHERALAHFLEAMRAAPRPELRLDAEDRCFHHLEALRPPLIERRAWARLEGHTAAARLAGPARPRHRQLLALYDGLVAIQTQRYAQGESALGVLLAQPDVDAEVRMRALNVLAHARWFQSDYDGAFARYQQVYELASAGGSALYQGHALHNMGLVYHELGLYAQALDLAARSLEIFRALGDHYHVAHLLYEVGKNAMQLGRWRDAAAQFEEAAQLYARLGVDAQLANLLCLQGMLRHALGDEAEAEDCYRRSLAIGLSPEHGSAAVAMDCQLLLALLCHCQGRLDEALELCARAAALAEQLRNAHALALAHFRRGSVQEAQGQHEAALAAYNAAIGLVETLRGDTASEDLKLGLLGATHQMYEALVLALLRAGRHAEAYHAVERARSRALLDLLAARSPDLRAAFDQPVATLAEVQAQLPPGALLVEFYTAGVMPSGEHMLNALPHENARLRRLLVQPPAIVAFALSADGLRVIEATPDPNLFAPSPEEPRPGRRWLQGRKLRALYDQLLGPLHAEIAACERLLLIPHGPLHYLPFLAMRAPDGRYLLDAGGPVVALAPSATLLLRRGLGTTPPNDVGSFLAIGYNDASAGLLHAESEARAIARLAGGVAWVGETPKGAALVAAAPGLRGLHIAGHAAYDERDPLRSALSLGAGDQLTAREVMRDLSLRAELVTISACMSGLNRVVPGDELIGPLRAWLYAGAATVVCAQWEASDIVARLLMERFYELLAAGASPGAAFRDALVAVREISGGELAATFARWRADEPDAPPDAFPAIPPDQRDARIFADPVVWAPFTLFGKP
jgi:CHAT domain-containing protein/tetratricopeptide (TPR) repeat protein